MAALAAGLLLFLLIIGAYVIGFVGWGSPGRPTCTQPNIAGFGIMSNPDLFECGETNIIIPVGSSFGDTILNFQTPMRGVPVVHAFPIINVPVVGLETIGDFANLVTISTTLTTSKQVLATENVALSIGANLALNPQFKVALEVDIVTNSGMGTPTIWAEGFDCNVDGGGGTAWETFGETAQTPKISTTGTGFVIGTRFNVNMTLLNDISACDNGLFPFNNEYVLLRVVGLTSTGTRTFTIKKLTISEVTITPAVVITCNNTPNPPGNISIDIEASGSPGNYRINWDARII